MSPRTRYTARIVATWTKREGGKPHIYLRTSVPVRADGTGAHWPLETPMWTPDEAREFAKKLIAVCDLAEGKQEASPDVA
jgi:hypothetical protein